MSSFQVFLHDDAAESLDKMDSSIKERVIRRIARMREESAGRHMKYGLGFFVEELGQYRIVYACDEDTKIIYFIGDHKEYEKWYSKPRTGRFPSTPP